MRYLLFNWDTVENPPNDPTELTDIEFEELCQNDPTGFVIETTEDFEAKFNAEHFSVHTHQLRIIS